MSRFRIEMPFGQISSIWAHGSLALGADEQVYKVSDKKANKVSNSSYCHSFSFFSNYSSYLPFIMYLTTFFTSAVLATSAVVLASPTPVLEKRATTICGQWDTVETGTYTIYQDLWGESAATSGSQCTTVTSDSSDTLVWSTSWTWAGGSTSVKSYANAVVSQSTGIKLSTITSIPTTWDWR